MTKDEFLQEKKKAIRDICVEQLSIQGGSDISGAFKLHMLEVRKYMIAAQPFPKFPKVGSSSEGIAIVGERGKEEVIINRKK